MEGCRTERGVLVHGALWRDRRRQRVTNRALRERGSHTALQTPAPHPGSGREPRHDRHPSLENKGRNGLLYFQDDQNFFNE